MLADLRPMVVVRLAVICGWASVFATGFALAENPPADAMGETCEPGNSLTIDTFTPPADASGPYALLSVTVQGPPASGLRLLVNGSEVDCLSTTAPLQNCRLNLAPCGAICRLKIVDLNAPSEAPCASQKFVALPGVSYHWTVCLQAPAEPSNREATSPEAATASHVINVVLQPPAKDEETTNTRLLKDAEALTALVKELSRKREQALWLDNHLRQLNLRAVIKSDATSTGAELPKAHAAAVSQCRADIARLEHERIGQLELLQALLEAAK